jgi:hypothetical protein
MGGLFAGPCIYSDVIDIVHIKKSRIVVGDERKILCNEIFQNEQFIS